MQTPLTSDEQFVPVQVVRPAPGIGFSLLWLAVLFVVQIAVGIAVGIVAIAVGLLRGGSPQDLVTQDSMVIPMLLFGTLANLFVALAAVLLHYRRHVRNALALRPVSMLHAAMLILTAPPLAVVASEVTNWAAEVLPNLALNAAFFENLQDQPWILVLIGGCLLPGVGEELLFRGFIGRGLVARHGILVGVLITSVLFGVIHMEPIQVCGVFVIGVALHLVFLSSKSLVAPMVLHALNNVIALSAPALSQMLPIPGFTVTGENQVLHTPLPLVAAALVALMALGWLFYQTRTRWMTEQQSEWSPGYPTAEAPPVVLGAHALQATPSAAAILLCAATYVAFGLLLVQAAA